MFLGLQSDQLEGALEALLFVTDEPVSALRLAEMLEIDVIEVERRLDNLQESLAAANRGVQLREVAGGWRMFTHPVYHELIEKYVISWDTRKLTAAALETLAIVAYTQPTTRAQVSSIRGVSSDSPINSLVEKGLLREAGVADSPGNPVLYATSTAFLEKFGLRSVADLPPLEDFAPDEETRALIRERLSAHRVADDAVICEDEEPMDEGASPLDKVVFELEDDEVDSEFVGLSASELAESLVARIGFESDAPADIADAADAPAGVSDAAEATSSSNIAVEPSPNSLLAQALAQMSGTVEKIDFDSLVFEDDDE